VANMTDHKKIQDHDSRIKSIVENMEFVDFSD
jgi:hypothetical protein